jgi:parvulin-like peptidyl-prolyl isomerase
MLTRVSATVPTAAEQVHVRQVLVSSQALAQTIRDRARKGEELAALAKQYSIDAVSKANGGDLGWLAKGMVDPRLDAVLFVLPVGQVSDVVTTGYGFAVVQVIEKDASRALSAELIQSKKQAVFLTWLQAVRSGSKIEKLVQP